MTEDDHAHVVPALSVLVCSMGRPGIEDTLDSVHASADAAGAAVEVLVAWQATDAPPHDLAATTISVFPAGVGYARNRGLRLAGAGVIAFVDDDELVDPGWVAAVVAGFDDPAVDAAFGPVRPRDARGLAYCSFERGTPRTFTAASTPPWLVGTGGNMAFRTQALLEAGGFDPAFGAGAVAQSAEDAEIIVRLLKQGRTLAWLPNAAVYHPTKTREERFAARYPYGYGAGKIVRRHRDAMLAARYLQASWYALTGAARARDGRRWHEATRYLHGFLAGTLGRAELVAPRAALERLPDALRSKLNGAHLTPLPYHFRDDPHYVFRVEPDRMLHLYINPSAALTRATDVRATIAARVGTVGIPRLHAVETGVDALWILEDRLPGRHPAVGDGAWVEAAAAWAARLQEAGDGSALRETRGWDARTARLLEHGATDERSGLAHALEVVSALPARPAHGDFQPKNILVAPDGAIGAIDWEHAELEGLPAFDVLFLAVMAGGGGPDAEVVLALLEGRSSAESLRRRVLLAGVPDEALEALVRVTLAEWAARESARVAAPGFMSRSRPFLALERRCIPHLSS